MMFFKSMREIRHSDRGGTLLSNYGLDEKHIKNVLNKLIEDVKW